MWTYFPWCALVLVAGLSQGWDARGELRSHGPEEGGASVSTQASAPILTRQEALIKGLKQIQLSAEGVRDLVKATDQATSLTPQKFSQLVDKIVGTQGTLSKEQGDELKTLFKTELGAVKDSPVGAELNTAAKRVLEIKETTQAANAPQPQIKSPEGNTAIGATLPPAVSKGQPAVGNDSLADKKLELAQSLVRDLEARQRGAAPRGRSEGGLLDALRAGLLDAKNNKEEGGRSSGSEALGDLKNALTHNQPPPPLGRKNDKREEAKKEDTKKPEPPPRPDRDGGGNSNLASVFKGRDSGNNNNKDAKTEEKFVMPTAKSKDDADSKKLSKIDPSAASSAGDAPLDPSKEDLLKNMLSQGQGNKSPLPGINGGGGGFGGGSDYGGGGSSMGPNIIGSGSAPAGGNFPGDPFSGLGAGTGGYGGSSGSSFAKSVVYGSGGGEISDAGVTSGGEGTGYVPEAAKTAASKATPMVLVLNPVEDSTKRSLLDYFGKLKNTLCAQGMDSVAEICRSATARKIR